MSALARRWGYVVVAAGLGVAWIMWAAVGVHSVDEDALMSSVADFEDLPGMVDEGAVGTGAFGGVISTSYGYWVSNGAVAATILVACVLIAFVTIVRRRAIVPLILAVVATLGLVLVVDAVQQTRDPVLVARPLPLTVMVVASLVAFAAACVLLVDALRGRPPRTEG
ncbi:MAG TPA: hypothetical protein PLV41_12195 [Miltoncostaeales bacterium]|nr:hypothetical protein [Miltoncostaeales bacterium]